VKLTTFLLVALTQIAAVAHQPPTITPEIVVVQSGALQWINKPQVLKFYSAVGKTPEEGHNFVYSAVDRWETDVFKFLDANVR
jgi:hypothetical protein